jgi:hypothetical protein
MPQLKRSITTKDAARFRNKEATSFVGAKGNARECGAITHQNERMNLLITTWKKDA